MPLEGSWKAGHAGTQILPVLFGWVCCLPSLSLSALLMGLLAVVIVVVSFSACVCCAFCHFRLSNICRLLAYCQANFLFFFYFVSFCNCVCVDDCKTSLHEADELYRFYSYLSACPSIPLYINMYISICQSVSPTVRYVCLSVCRLVYLSHGVFIMTRRVVFAHFIAYLRRPFEPS